MVRKVALQENDRRDIGDYAAPELAQSEDGSGQKNPARNVDQVAQRKEQDEKQQSGHLVGQDLLLQEIKAEMLAQARQFEAGEEQRAEGQYGKQSAIGAGRQLHCRTFDSVAIGVADFMAWPVGNPLMVRQPGG